jgi:hypothetical protein
MRKEQEASSAQTTTARFIALARESEHLATLIAQNNSAPAEVLEELASPGEAILEKILLMNPPSMANPWISPDAYQWNYPAKIRQLVAQNPNAPMTLLLRLAGHFPDAFASNPALPLLLMAHTDLFLKLSEQTARRLIQSGNQAILTILVGHPDTIVRRTIAEHPGTTAEHLDVLAKDSVNLVVQFAARHPNLSASTCLLLARHPSAGIRYRLSQNPSATYEALWVLSSDANESIREHATERLSQLVQR